MTHLTPAYTAARISTKKRFRIHLLVFALTIPAIWMVWYLTDKTYPWPLWQTVAWSIGVLFHYLGAFIFESRKTIKNQTS